MTITANAFEPHPPIPSSDASGAIRTTGVLRQCTRPLEIAIINLMADKRATERQLSQWLGHPTLPVHLTFVATDDYFDSVQAGYEPRNTPADHIRRCYRPFRDIRRQTFDGLIVTGVNAQEHDITREAIWSHVCDILDWSATNVLSSLFLCWAGQAALKHFYNIDRTRSTQKTFGVFDHAILSDRTRLLAGFPDVFPVPVARWNEVGCEALLPHPELEIVAASDEVGLSFLADPAAYDHGRGCYPRRAFILCHPEYDTDSLLNEYLRDTRHDPALPPPRHYFPKGNTAAAPRNVWRHTGHVYTNWIHILHKVTSFELAQIPEAQCADFNQ